MALDGFESFPFSEGEATRDVYRLGSGPGVVIMHEIPGITPEVEGFARRVANRVIFMDAGQIVEQNEPELFFTKPQHERTKLFLSQILH